MMKNLPIRGSWMFFLLTVITGHVVAAERIPSQGTPPGGPSIYLRTDFGAELNRSTILELPEVVAAVQLSASQRKLFAERQAAPRTSKRFAPPQASGARPEPEKAEDRVKQSVLNQHTPQQALIATTAEASRLAEVIERIQMQRLNQIFAQVLDGHALGDPVIAGQLGLSPEQRWQLDQIREEAALAFLEQTKESLASAKGDPSLAIVKAYANVVSVYGNKSLAVLKPEQLAAFQQLKGNPIALSEGSRNYLTAKAVARYLQILQQAQATR